MSTETPTAKNDRQPEVESPNVLPRSTSPKNTSSSGTDDDKQSFVSKIGSVLPSAGAFATSIVVGVAHKVVVDKITYPAFSDSNQSPSANNPEVKPETPIAKLVTASQTDDYVSANPTAGFELEGRLDTFGSLVSGVTYEETNEVNIDALNLSPINLTT